MPPMEISLTIDLEDPSAHYAPNGRYVPMTRKILDLCEAMGERKATFFTVGRVGEVAPDLVREIAARGHEIAYHSHNHISLTEETPEKFRQEAKEDKDRLEQLSGKEVIGFRAPRFSLMPQTIWALDVLKDLGFRYSSSIMPTDVSLFGFPNASRVPFAWPNGIVEFPLPTVEIGKYRLPYLGGIYLYSMPFPVVKAFLAKVKNDEVLWTYAHPYDFDRNEKFTRLPHTSLWISLVLWQARRKAEKKIKKLLSISGGRPLGARFAEMHF